jgi:hypothetical protein
MSEINIWGSREREQARWQLQAARLLIELLQRAHREELPPLRWQVQAAGARLVGFVEGGTFDHGPDAAAAYERWFGVLTELQASEPIEAFARRRSGAAVGLRATVTVEHPLQEGRRVPERRAVVSIAVDLDEAIDKGECPGCDRGEYVRQLDNGDLVCARCGRLTARAGRDDG